MSTGPPIWPAGIRLLADSPDPARQQRVAQCARRAPAVEQHADRRRIEHERQQVEQRDQQQTPAGQRQGREHGRQALRDEQPDEQQHARLTRSHAAARAVSLRRPRRAAALPRAAAKTWRKPK